MLGGVGLGWGVVYVGGGGLCFGVVYVGGGVAKRTLF